jgi:hypothetical protein
MLINMINQLKGQFSILNSVPKAVPDLGPNVLSKTNMTIDEKKQLYSKLTQFHKDALADYGFPNAKVEFKTIWHDATTDLDSVNIYGNQFRRNFFFEILKSSEDKKGYVAMDERILFTVDTDCPYWEQYPLANVNANNLPDAVENRLYSVPLADLIPVNVKRSPISTAQQSRATRVQHAYAPLQDEPEVSQAVLDFELEQLSSNDFKAEDQHYSNLSVLDLLAIIQCEPISSKDYLNEAIKKVKQKRSK